MTQESFRPIANVPPATLKGKVTFYGRMVLDLQIYTVYRDLRKQLPTYRGRVLDVGCGQSPYRFLLDPQATEYVGIDVLEADEFDYHNSEIVPFDGVTIPFPDEHFDAVICTEVLEHVSNFQRLVDEMFRVMKDGAEAIVTVPWSARNHYMPYDFFRYTPESLRTIFANFDESQITPRGTDLSVIGSKFVVVWARNIMSKRRGRPLIAPLWIVASPILLIFLAIAHVCIATGAGSTDDPLGYTVVVKK